MCGRFTVNKEHVVDWVMENMDVPFSCVSNDDLRPTQKVATLAHLNDSITQLDTSWGIKPAWSKRLIINAQGETALNKKTFSESFRSKRCLVPCSGWYEWRDEGGRRKQKYLFSSSDQSPLLMAGIWFDTGEIPELVTLTTHPNEKCSAIHNRMPVIIKKQDVDYWFNSSAEMLKPLIEPIKNDSISITSC